jgi:NAD(P)-dependent dehydrogenase (short-subunit alcohol dehydrogenase family)
MSRNSGKRILVTGAGGGIGRAAAERLATDGARVVVMDLDQGAAARVEGDLIGMGRRAKAVCSDVSDEDSLQRGMVEAVDYLGGLDSVVTCAGISLHASMNETSLDLWNLTIRVNLTGTFLTIKHSLPHLDAAGGGSIVTLGSLTSLVAGGRSASYDASKGGVLQLTRAVAAEWADRGVRANCVCPGGTNTELRANSLRIAEQRAITTTQVRMGLRVESPMARAAEAHEIASVIAFLCSEDASFMTGAAIPVDGGYTAI